MRQVIRCADARLRAGKVLVIGVGGLGSPAALALAQAGVGTIGLIDPDTVELSNLQRQILHATPDLGKQKVKSARHSLLEIDPELKIHVYPTSLHVRNFFEVTAEYDFLLDATDGLSAKFLINDGAVLANKPYSYAGIVQFQGQTLTVVPNKSACLRCLFPIPPSPDEVPTCQQAGILGSVAGSLGVLQAAEAIKYLRREGTLLTDRLITYDAMRLRWREVEVRRNPRCPLCGVAPAITSLQQSQSLPLEQGGRFSVALAGTESTAIPQRS